MNHHAREIIRYGINGVVATTVHYTVLTFSLQVLMMPSAGLANFVAAMFGITASFIGSRYYVFPKTGEGVLVQAAKFGGLYGAIAILHGLVLLIWTDWWGNDYRVGFVLATGLQVAGSYVGNKLLVFKV